MRHWLQVATRNWRTRRLRAALAVGAVALGVGVVVWVTCCYESVRRSVTDAVLEWIGRSHIIIEPVEGVWAVFDDSVEKEVASVPGVAVTTLRTREYVEAAPPGAKDTSDWERIEISGMIPEKEEAFRKYQIGEGRFIKPADENGLLVERLLADEFHLHPGDQLALRPEDSSKSTNFKILGIVERRRASINQAPMVWGRMIDVQKLCKLPGKVKSVDIMLHDPSVPNIQKTAEQIRKLLDERRSGPQSGDHGTSKLEVKTTEAQLQKLAAAQGLLQFIMTELGCVVLLTAFFIILAAMSMGVTERIAELGLLRSVGVTRGQMMKFVFAQMLPLGLLGTLIGIPLGLFLQAITLWAAPQYLGRMAFSPTGIILGVVGGIGTTLLGAFIPAISASLISPAEALRAQASFRAARWVIVCGVVALILLGILKWLLSSLARETIASFDFKSLASLITLYAAGTAIVPLVVFILGGPAARLAAKLLRLGSGLLVGDIKNAPFRSAAICSGLMVGLSLIVGLAVWGDSVKAGWQFPKEFPDAMLYTYEAIPLEMMRPLANTPGVGQFTVTDDFAFSLSKPSFLRPFRILDEFSRFLAIDVDSGLPMVK
ncbi:MAG TPA: FtsX-like permease family protein, partial [Phycisphaerae bacterium]|nr:FtsX-like permease family protein [Phycisphaerae bacterium]